MIKKITILVVLLFAITIKAQDVRYTIKNLKINNSYSNFGTTFYGDTKVVYASPKRKSYIIKNEWDGNKQPFLDLYTGDIADDAELNNVEKFSSELNTRYHEADVAFTKDGKTVYFSRNNYLNKEYKKDSTGFNLIQLYRAEVGTNGNWTKVEPMPFNSDQYQTGHPALSADEKTLYFISDMPGSLGKTDIYKSLIFEDGKIGEPINLGSKINTIEREMFPFISVNNELYFSSDGRKDGLGALDVYVIEITNNNNTNPQNLGAPINSISDDFAFIINTKSNKGYFSSNRKGGKGDDDIYAFTQNSPIFFECFQKVKGQVTDAKTGRLVSGSLVVLFDNNDTELKRTIVGNNAQYYFDIECDNGYKIASSKEGYTGITKEFKSTKENYLEIPLTVKLEDFIVKNGNCIIKIDPIYFDFDKSNIRPDAKLELNKVVEVMKKYPELIIEGDSHTDTRGNSKYNEDLSARRAKSTVEYIISKGIDAKRIIARGYGESQLVNGCSEGVKCSNQNHQLNRRTEFVVVNIDEVRKNNPELCSVKIDSTAKKIEE